MRTTVPTLDRSLKSKEHDYRQLDQAWQEFCRLLVEGTQRKSYQIQGMPDGHSLSFWLFGKQAFVEFSHNFQDGCITYGIETKSEESGNTVKQKVVSFHFDKLGNCMYFGENIRDAAGAGELHLTAVELLCESSFLVPEGLSTEFKVEHI